MKSQASGVSLAHLESRPHVEYINYVARWLGRGVYIPYDTNTPAQLTRQHVTGAQVTQVCLSAA
jgi:hypothetical protein